ncbi:MAG: YesL family protein [bacterium]
MDNNFLADDSPLYKVLEWISRLVFINIYWIFFTLLGLVIFGFMPSTLAMFSIIDRFLKGEENIKIFRDFWHEYKANFLKINFIGLIMIIIGLILYIDLQYFKDQSGLVFTFLTFLIWLFILFYIFVFIYIFPIYNRYDLKIYHILKNALFFIFITPLETIQMILVLFLPLIFFRYLPSLLPFLGISLPVLLMSWVANRTIVKVEEKIMDNN